MQSKLTMIGLYNYDPTLFDNMLLPSGISSDTVRDEILMKSGEFEVLYSDIAFMKLAIGHWSRKHYRTFEKWLTALNIEYDPLYNYDRTEEYTDTHNGTGKRKSTSDNTHSDNLTRSHNLGSVENSVNNSTGETTENNSPAQTTNTRTTTVAAFDSNTYQPKEQTADVLTLQLAGSDSSSTTTSGASSNQRSENANEAENNAGTSKNVVNDETSNNETITHKARLFGNIGVTTSQQMLQSELDIARFNLFEQIADLFVSEFCLMIY